MAINSLVSPVHSTIEKLDGEMAKMLKYIVDLEQKSHFQNNEIISLKTKVSVQEMISRDFEDENVQLKNELFEASQCLNQNTGHVQEIVRNVLEIKELREALNNEKQKNKQLKEELKNEKHENDLKRALLFEKSQELSAANLELKQEKLRNSIILSLQDKEIISLNSKLKEQETISGNLEKDNTILKIELCNKNLFIKELNQQKEISKTFEKENSKMKEEHNDLITQIFSLEQEKVKNAKEIRHLKEGLNYEKEKYYLKKSKEMYDLIVMQSETAQELKEEKQRNSKILRENESILSELEQKSLFQKGQIVHMKDKLDEQRVISRNLETDNTQLRKLLKEARQILKIIEDREDQEKENVKENIKHRLRKKNCVKRI